MARPYKHIKVMNENEQNEALDNIAAALGIKRDLEVLARYQEYPHLISMIAENMRRANRIIEREQRRINRIDHGGNE